MTVKIDYSAQISRLDNLKADLILHSNAQYIVEYQQDNKKVLSDVFDYMKNEHPVFFEKIKCDIENKMYVDGVGEVLGSTTTGKPRYDITLSIGEIKIIFSYNEERDLDSWITEDESFSIQGKLSAEDKGVLNECFDGYYEKIINDTHYNNDGLANVCPKDQIKYADEKKLTEYLNSFAN